MSKWTSDAGPRQTKQVSDALGDLRMASKVFRTVSGVHDGTTAKEAWAKHVADEAARGCHSEMINLFGAVENPVAVQRSTEIGERYNYTITRTNYTQIINDIRVAIPKTKPCRR